jgi:hypothetical protein
MVPENLLGMPPQGCDGLTIGDGEYPQWDIQAGPIGHLQNASRGHD